jgi:hypothetical protein
MQITPQLTRQLTRRALVALVASGLAGPAATSTFAGGDALTCEIHVRENAGTVALEAIVSATAATEGTYKLQVSGGGSAGSSDMTQSGEFSVTAGEQSAVGSVTLASDGGSYVADLSVTAGTSVHRCTRRIVGSL